MRNIFGLGKREAGAITLDVTSKVYRKRLAQAVRTGDLAAADSKAAYLQNLCEELHFDPQKAIEIHQGNIYMSHMRNLVYVIIPIESQANLLECVIHFRTF